MTVVKLKKMFDSKYLIVYNPISGRRKSRQVAEQIHFEFNQKARSSIITGKDEDSTREILQREIPNHDAVIAVGGDGLMNLVIQLLAHSPKPLHVYPAGSGNDFQRTNFSFKKGKSKLVEDLNKSTEKVIDLALVKFSNYSRYFGQVLSAGFDSYVNARANKLKRIPGTLKYVVALLLELPSFKQLRYKLEIDGELISAHPDFADLEKIAARVGVDVWQLIIGGGEDHAFLATGIDLPFFNLCYFLFLPQQPEKSSIDMLYRVLLHIY